MLFVPRVTVAVVDKTGGTPNRIVDNVPFGIAALGGLTSSIGNTITELFETAFQTLPGPAALPSELAYQRNGLMFGSRLIQETRRTAIPDPAVRTDLLNFVHNCTAYDIADGTISPTAFAQSSDLWSLMSFTNPARFSTLTSPAGVNVATCDAVYASIGARLPAQINTLTDQLASRLNPSLPTLAARAAVLSQIPQAYIRSQIAAAAASAADLIRQNALINAINDAGELGCQRINDPSCMMLATGRAQAVAAQNAAWINGAKISEQALPVVRNVAEAMIYAVFPLVVLLLFLTNGRTTLMMLSGYAIALIAIQLWPPLFAILNYMASLYAQIDQAAAAELGGGAKALSLQTASPIYSNAVSAQAVVAYLIIGIPLLAYSVMGGLQGLSSASVAGNPAAAAAAGNVTAGNVTMDQRTVSPSTSNPWVSRDQSPEGNWITTTASGAQATSYLRNESAVSRVVSTRVSQSSVQEASRAAEAARSDVLAASSDLSSTLVDTMSRGASTFRSTARNDGQVVSSSSELGASADRLRAISESVGRTTGLTAQQVASIAFELSGGIGAGKGIFPFKASATASGGKTYSNALSQSEQLVGNALTSEQLRDFKSFADRVTRDQSFVRGLGSDERESEELASRLSKSVARLQTAQSTYAERASVAERLSTAYEKGEVLGIDLAQLPANSDLLRRYNELAARYGPDSLALQAAMSSELASRALPPLRALSGAALPWTFVGVREVKERNDADPALSLERVSAADTDSDRALGRRIGTRDLVPPSAPSGLNHVRDIINGSIAERNAKPTAASTFDQRNEIMRNPDGTVSSRKSQATGNLRQIRDDAWAMYENAKEGLASLGGTERRRTEEDSDRLTRSERQRAINATPDVPPTAPADGKLR